MKLHILTELIKLPAIGQWRAACSCGHESFDASKVEAVNWHRTHIKEARKDAYHADRFMQAEALNTGEVA
jgi:hypothetical protein